MYLKGEGSNDFEIGFDQESEEVANEFLDWFREHTEWKGFWFNAAEEAGVTEDLEVLFAMRLGEKGNYMLVEPDPLPHAAFCQDYTLEEWTILSSKCPIEGSYYGKEEHVKMIVAELRRLGIANLTAADGYMLGVKMGMMDRRIDPFTGEWIKVTREPVVDFGDGSDLGFGDPEDPMGEDLGWE